MKRSKRKLAGQASIGTKLWWMHVQLVFVDPAIKDMKKAALAKLLLIAFYSVGVGQGPSFTIDPLSPKLLPYLL
jgi:hypothetical protein